MVWDKNNKTNECEKRQTLNNFYILATMPNPFSTTHLTHDIL